MDAETKEYLTYDEVADRLGYAASTIRMMVSNGIFHPVRTTGNGMKRGHKKYINTQQVEAFERGEVSHRSQDRVPPILPVPDNMSDLASMDRPGSGGNRASSYAQNISMLYRHPATYMLLLTMVDDMTAHGIPVADAYKLAFEVAPTLLSELDKEEDIMQNTPREIISKATGKDHPSMGKIESIMREHGINLDRPIDGSTPTLEEQKLKSVTTGTDIHTS